MRDQRLLALAKWMRSNPTPAEARLWYQLRARRFDTWKWKHQTVLAPYIADFTCRSAMLLVEVDGDTHGISIDEDARRTAFLERQGWRVLRFTNAEVIGNIEGVLTMLSSALPLSRPPRLSPVSATLSPEGEREQTRPSPSIQPPGGCPTTMQAASSPRS